MPVIGICIAVLCLAAFFPTWVLADDVEGYDRAAYDAFKAYYDAHPYLKLPSQLDDGEVDTDTGVERPSPAVVAQEQAELDRLLQAVLESTGGPMRKWALVPKRGLSQPGWVTSLFLHFGWMHLLGNLLFLYIVAPLLEDAWGRIRFLLFYLAGGLVANLAQYVLDPHASTMIAGASGAIAACMGAFSVRFASSKVRMAYFIWLIRVFVGTALVPAWVCGLAWFGFELFDLARGGAHGVATGAHVGGFLLGAAVAFGMKALGKEKELKTAEEAELDTAHKSDLMQSAEIAAARGDFDVAKENLQELLRLMPGREDAELLLGEVDLRLGNGAARLERTWRKLVAAKQDSTLMTSLVRVWPHMDATKLSVPFSLQLAKHIKTMKYAKLEPMIDPLLKHVASAGGRLAAEAQQLESPLPRRGEGQGEGAVDVQRSEANGVDQLQSDQHSLSENHPSPNSALTPALSPTGERGPALLGSVTPVTFRGVSAQGLALISDGQQRVIPFDRILAIHAVVVPTAGRRVLVVDLVVRKQPPLALRLTSDDPAVPALFPGTSVPQAWKTFIDKLLITSKAVKLPDDPRPGFPEAATLDDATQAWSSWAHS